MGAGSPYEPDVVDAVRVKMLVTRLRCQGLRLKAHELEEPQLLNLRLGEWPAPAPAKTMLRVVHAHALEVYGNGIYREVFPPIFEPTLVAMGEDGFALSGMEYQSDGCRVREVRQVWRCRVPPTDSMAGRV